MYKIGSYLSYNKSVYKLESINALGNFILSSRTVKLEISSQEAFNNAKYIELPKMDEVYIEHPFTDTFKIVAFDELNGEIVNVIMNNVDNQQHQRKEHIFDFLKNYSLVSKEDKCSIIPKNTICDHNWKYITLFTSTVTECSKCKEVKQS